MQVPAGYDGDFLWMEYLKKTKSQSAPLSLFLHKDEYKHAFKVGHVPISVVMNQLSVTR